MAEVEEGILLVVEGRHVEDPGAPFFGAGVTTGIVTEGTARMEVAFDVTQRVVFSIDSHAVRPVWSSSAPVTALGYQGDESL